MAANAQILMHMTSASQGDQNGQIILDPVRDRNGIYEYSGKTVNGAPGVILDTSETRLTASVRQGVPADFLSGKQRVKRRVTLKAALPISVPGAVNPLADYINVDVVISLPVEATEDQIRTALNAVHTAVFDGADSPLRDLVVYGREPY